MLGHLVVDRTGKGWRCRLEEERVLGLHMLRALVPAPPGLREKVLRRRVYRAGERLWEQGVNRVLVEEDFSPELWEPLRRAGLAPVESETLCREMAAPLVLALLERKGLDPAKSVVCLAGSCALGAMQNAAEALSRQVGKLIIDCPGRGEVLSLWLHQEYGLPLMEPGSVPPDVTVSFSPEKEADLLLCGPAPDLGGLRLAPKEGTLPEGFDGLPLLAALRESGCLEREAIQIVTEIKFHTTVGAGLAQEHHCQRPSPSVQESPPPPAGASPL